MKSDTQIKMLKLHITAFAVLYGILTFSVNVGYIMQTSLRCSYQCGTCPVHKRNEAARVTFSGRGNGQRKEEEKKQELGTTGQIYCSSPRICTTCKPAGDTGTDLLHLNGRAQDLLKDGCWCYRINPFGLLSHGHCVSSTVINLET